MSKDNNSFASWNKDCENDGILNYLMFDLLFPDKYSDPETDEDEYTENFNVDNYETSEGENDDNWID